MVQEIVPQTKGHVMRQKDRLLTCATIAIAIAGIIGISPHALAHGTAPPGKELVIAKQATSGAPVIENHTVVAPLNAITGYYLETSTTTAAITSRSAIEATMTVTTAKKKEAAICPQLAGIPSLGISIAATGATGGSYRTARDGFWNDGSNLKKIHPATFRVARDAI